MMNTSASIFPPTTWRKEWNRKTIQRRSVGGSQFPPLFLFACKTKLHSLIKTRVIQRCKIVLYSWGLAVLCVTRGRWCRKTLVFCRFWWLKLATICRERCKRRVFAGNMVLLAFFLVLCLGGINVNIYLCHNQWKPIRKVKANFCSGQLSAPLWLRQKHNNGCCSC